MCGVTAQQPFRAMTWSSYDRTYSIGGLEYVDDASNGYAQLRGTACWLNLSLIFLLTRVHTDMYEYKETLKINGSVLASACHPIFQLLFFLLAMIFFSM